jgi:hypothetical protein
VIACAWMRARGLTPPTLSDRTMSRSKRTVIARDRFHMTAVVG